MNLLLKKLIHLQVGTKAQSQKVFILVLLLCLSLLLYLQPAGQSSSNQTQKKQKIVIKVIKHKSSRNTITKTEQVQKLDLIQLSSLHLQKKTSEQPLGSNAGDSVSVWNKKIIGIDSVPWCGTYGSYLTQITDATPKFKTGRAIGFLTDKSYTLKQVMRGDIIPERGWAVVKSRVGGNHIDFVIDYDKTTHILTVIGGNVGDKVSIRKVKLCLTDKKTYQIFTPINI